MHTLNFHQSQYANGIFIKLFHPKTLNVGVWKFVMQQLHETMDER